MKYKVVDRAHRHFQPNNFYLIEDNWNDWFKYKTLYELKYCDSNSNQIYIGQVKIGQFDKVFSNYERPDIESEFEYIGTHLFSLGQESSYYENLRLLGSEICNRVLVDLNDVAFNIDIFESAISLNVMRDSLLRFVSSLTVRGQFNRIATGGKRLEAFSFNFIMDQNKTQQINLNFEIIPEKKPSSNIHVIIGRNGVGKTRLLRTMINTIFNLESKEHLKSSRFESSTQISKSIFSKVVALTFSAFDQDYPLELPKSHVSETEYSYIGLKKLGQCEFADDENKIELLNKSNTDLVDDFSSSLKNIRSNRLKENWWLKSLDILETDPLLQEIGLRQLLEDSRYDSVETKEIFRKLSSGHKIVILSITKLIEEVEERTLVLIDEPEAHLHPPLLSAYIRAISNLLVFRNGVALIATHSPVVLQEVPMRCVWKLGRSHTVAKAERLNIETFGENIGILTREVFGYQVTKSGFHDLLNKEIDTGKSFEEVQNAFNYELGQEALAIIRTLCNRRR